VSDVVVQNQPRNRVSGGLSVDNQGSAATGEHRGTLNLALDNPLGLNDAWFGSFSRNLDARPSRRLSESILVGANFAYGYWNFNGNVSESRYASEARSLTQQFRSTGNTASYNIGLQRVLSRGQAEKLTLNAGLTHKNSQNFIEGSLLTTGSPRLTDVRLGLTSVFAAGAGSWIVDGSFSKGLTWFGVEPLPGAGNGTVPDPTGIRYNAAVSYVRPLALGALDATWSSSLQAQTSPDVLYGSEQISIGGLFTVRGFDGTSLAGDRGLYWRNDLTFTLPPPSNATLAKRLGRLQPYLALDVGHIYGREGQISGTLAGMLVGLRGVGGQIGFDIGWGRPVHVSTTVKARGRIEDHSLYTRVSVAF
jgi:hemolysin activation/secretion protein